MGGRTITAAKHAGQVTANRERIGTSLDAGQEAHARGKMDELWS